jgi:hypothetical protein
MVPPSSFVVALDLLARRFKGRAMTFVKGKSGNPSGRPKLPEGSLTRREAAEMFARLAPRALQRLQELLESDDERIAMRASEIIVERHLGKIAEAQPVAQDEGKVDTVDFVPAVVTHTAAE